MRLSFDRQIAFADVAVDASTHELQGGSAAAAIDGSGDERSAVVAEGQFVRGSAKAPHAFQVAPAPACRLRLLSAPIVPAPSAWLRDNTSRNGKNGGEKADESTAFPLEHHLFPSLKMASSIWLAFREGRAIEGAIPGNFQSRFRSRG
ncbi:MAG: hypothetical protein OES09_13800 [Gammaproteobacteria bacterium]|nr:hypothetical protein [Gammaproteobacteria bacterium]